MQPNQTTVNRVSFSLEDEYSELLRKVAGKTHRSMTGELREMIVLRAIDLGVIRSRDIQTSGQLQPQE